MALLIEQPWNSLTDVYGPADRQLGPLGRRVSHELDLAIRNHEPVVNIVQRIHFDVLEALAMAGL